MSLKRTLKESVLRACGGHRLWGEEDTHAAEHVELLKQAPDAAGPASALWLGDAAVAFV